MADLQTWFEELNRAYFGSKLPMPRLALSRASTRLGSMSFCQRRRLFKTELYGFTIRISTYYNQDQRGYRTVLLHEMIHYYIAFMRIADTSPHGPAFKKIMNWLNAKHGWDISVSSKLRREARMHPAVGGKTYLVLALAMKNGDKFLSVVNPAYARRIDMQLKALPEAESISWTRTTDAYFAQFPAVRSLRGRRVDRETFSKYSGI